MTDKDRNKLIWSVRFVEPDEVGDKGVVTPGWYVVGWEDGREDGYSSIAMHVAQHDHGNIAAASLAAVTAHLLNGYENARDAAPAEVAS